MKDMKDMKDRLKEHMGKNRDSYEIYNADYESIWAGIESELDRSPEVAAMSKRRVWSIRTSWRIAASILLIATLGISTYVYQSNSLKYSDGFSLTDLSPELGEAEIFYRSLVNSKLEILKARSIELDPIITQDLELLDQAYEDLKKDLKDNMHNEEVIDAMIQNYRIKLQLLETILEQIDSSDENKERNDTKVI